MTDVKALSTERKADLYPLANHLIMAAYIQLLNVENIFFYIRARLVLPYFIWKTCGPNVIDRESFVPTAHV